MSLGLVVLVKSFTRTATPQSDYIMSDKSADMKRQQNQNFSTSGLLLCMFIQGQNSDNIYGCQYHVHRITMYQCMIELKGIFALFVLRSAFSAFDFDHEQTNIQYMYRNEASKRNIA